MCRSITSTYYSKYTLFNVTMNKLQTKFKDYFIVSLPVTLFDELSSLSIFAYQHKLYINKMYPTVLKVNCNTIV